MTDETKPEPTEDTAAQAPADDSAQHPDDKKGLKAEIRGAIGKVAGIAVETGSMLAGNAGAGVSAEGEIAEHDTEEIVDRIDGEG